MNRLALGLCAAWILLSDSAAATGARQLADLNPGAAGSYPSNFTSFGGQLYFSAYTFSTGVELWGYNGTTVALAADINPTADDVGFGLEGNDSLPAWLTEFGGQLYFSAFHPARGAELWRFDGSQATRVSDINPDQNDAIKVVQNSSWPYGLTVLNDSLYFAATSSTTPQNYELWKYNASGVQQAANLHSDAGADHSSYPTGLIGFNGGLYFMADDGAHGWELWRHDGVETKLFDLNPGAAESSSYPKYFTPFNNELYFAAYTAAAGFELWRTDGASATLAADIQSGPESSFPVGLTVYKDALYFQAFDAATGYELRKFTGGAAALAADINPAGDSYPKNLTVIGDLLVFAANDGVNGWELWKFDGVNATIVTNLNAAGDAFPEQFTVLNGVLYFTATTPETGYEIWKFDGTGVTLAAEVNLVGDSFPRNLTAANGQLYFSATEDGISNWEPWVLDASTPVNQPPTVTLTSPAHDSSFLTTDIVTISADATDDSAVVNVEFYADGRLLGTDDNAPYVYTGTFAVGTYGITARALDAAGESGTSRTITITVREPVANRPPTVSLTSPAEGATFLTTDAIRFAATADDDTGVARVEFYDGATLIGTANATPYEISASRPPGTHVLTATAFDIGGLGATSSPVTITVSEPTANQHPVITLSLDEAGRVLTAPAMVTLRAVATDADGIAEVQFFEGGNLAGSDPSAPYEVTKSGLSAGIYSFTAVARDNAGATTSSSTVEIRVVEQPVLTISRSGASVVLNVRVTSGVPHTIQASSDLVNWTMVQTVTPPDGNISFTDAASESARFYRVVAQ